MCDVCRLFLIMCANIHCNSVHMLTEVAEYQSEHNIMARHRKVKIRVPTTLQNSFSLTFP